MKFAVAVHGTRGDVEPCAAVGLELVRRGHEVRMAVPPNLVDFVDTAGLGPALPYGVDSQKQIEADVFTDWWKPRNPLAILRQAHEYIIDGWADMNETLTAMSEGADLILTGTTYQEVAANVAEYRHIPLAALHYFPCRPNSQTLSVPLPKPVLGPAWAIVEWGHWRLYKSAEDDQRRTLGLPKATTRGVRRVVEGGALEIQAYDDVFFPGLAEEWQGKRPLIGSLTMGLSTSVDDAVSSWIGAGTPPIYFGWGSMPVDSPAEAIALITDVCAELGERALICTGVWDVADIPAAEHVKVVRSVNHSAVFPMCRAIVHHGGAGTTAASVRSGVPTLVLWVGADQPVWANQVTRLKVGTARRFTATTRGTLLADLRTVLTPEYAARARAVAARMTAPAASVTAAADLLEASARKHPGR
ncbi:glycosyltransferase [Mycobacterium sp. DL592]|uniref:glycosyltransferase n=1 Tax=Mycobacterium sp. DL592 TaxID=2675524 RepID=UPI00141E3F2A|nr:glycosyltransferase [Mycobacterium sp. DL592]